MFGAKAFMGTQFVHVLRQNNVKICQTMLSAGAYYHLAERTEDPDARSIAQSRKITRIKHMVAAVEIC